jgi:hypothetical protein
MEETTKGQLTGWDIWHFIFAGTAIFTILNTLTGRHFTYKVEKSDDDSGYSPVFFVRVLTGQDNEHDYSYAGIIPVGGIADKRVRFRTTKNSRIGEDAQSVKALQWFLARAAINDLGPVEVYHEGRCGRCGRKLTTVESVTRGLGPVCSESLGY